MMLPGAAWWVWLGKRDRDGLEILAEILGISISFQALMALLLYLLKLQLTLPWLIGIYALFFIIVIAALFKRPYIKANWTWLIAALLFLNFIAWRMFQASELVLPAWVDSLHHVLIVRKMLEVGALPPDLTPYLQGPFYYHFAFHASAANYASLSGLDPAQAVLIWGQVLSAGVGLSVYHLGKIIFKDWRPAILATLLLTFVTKMPAYYLSWGRYTLLTGMLFLPLAMSAAIHYLQDKDRRNWLPVILLTAGTLLAHYFTAVLLALFLVILGLWHLFKGICTKEVNWKPLLSLILLVLMGLLLALPWLLRVFKFTGMHMSPEINIPEAVNGYFQNKDQWQYLGYLLGPLTGYILLSLAIPGLIISFWRKESRGLATWSLILFIFALPQGLKLGSFRFDHFAIVLFLPISILATLALSWSAQNLTKLFKPEWISKLVVCLIVFGLIIWGGIQTRDVVNSSTILANNADLKALEWIDANTPQDARFFVNTTGWGYNIYRGVDGGAWILPMTGRFSLAPTIFYPFGGDKEFTEQLNDWGARASNITTCDDTFWQLVEDAGLTHVFLREGKGSLSAAKLKNCSSLEIMYDTLGVSIWKIQH